MVVFIGYITLIKVLTLCSWQRRFCALHTLYIYIYIYNWALHTHTHTHIYIYMNEYAPALETAALTVFMVWLRGRVCIQIAHLQRISHNLCSFSHIPRTFRSYDNMKCESRFATFLSNIMFLCSGQSNILKIEAVRSIFFQNIRKRLLVCTVLYLLMIYLTMLSTPQDT